jgi:prepilin-type N-terminal cleavage/methylation domain-containing protein
VRRERGFTLLELLITLGVTTIGLVGLLSLHLSVARGNDGASRAGEAEQLCASELESLRAEVSTAAAPLSGLMTLFNGNPALVLPSTRIRFAAGRANLQYKITSTVSSMAAVSAGLVKIRTVVQWAEDGAALGAAGGAFDHQIALEILRTVEESL